MTEMRTNEQEYQEVELDGVTDRLKEHPDNPKRGAMAAIHESINVNGFYGAVVAQTSTGYILAGNHRYRAAVQQKAKSIPVIWLDVDDEEAKRILLADNRTADLGHTDEAALDALLSSLPSLEGTGYGESLQALLDAEEAAEGEGEDDGLPDPDEIPEDSHESQFGVVVMCKDGEHQRAVYEYLQQYIDEGLDPVLGGIELRVVAI